MGWEGCFGQEGEWNIPGIVEPQERGGLSWCILVDSKQDGLERLKKPPRDSDQVIGLLGKLMSRESRSGQREKAATTEVSMQLLLL